MMSSGLVAPLPDGPVEMPAAVEAEQAISVTAAALQVLMGARAQAAQVLTRIILAVMVVEPRTALAPEITGRTRAVAVAGRKLHPQALAQKGAAMVPWARSF